MIHCHIVLVIWNNRIFCTVSETLLYYLFCVRDYPYLIHVPFPVRCKRILVNIFTVLRCRRYCIEKTLKQVLVRNESVRE